MRIPTLLALSAASVAALPASNKLHKKQASPNAPNAFGLAFTTPPPMADGGAWSAAFERASSVSSQLTLEEKISIVTGQIGRCVGNTGAVPRLDIPAFCLQDGPTGPRPVDGHTQFPAGVTTAATWDRELIYERSRAMGQEFYDLGVHVALAPVTGGPLGRAARGGRNWEGWYADPYATGEASYLSVKGIQDAGVQACSKHFIAYEQETSRNLYINKTIGANIPGLPSTLQLPISSNLDDKTTHETYLWSFAEAVRAGTSSVMSSYNIVNGTHASANSDALNGLLKTELNFQGFVVSDWGGVWGTKEAVYGGNDLDMPGNGFSGILGIFYGDELRDMVNNGTVPESRLDDMIHRILTPYYASGQADKKLPDVPFNAGSLPGAEVTYRLVQKPSTVDLVRRIAEDGAILLKNEGGLPLKSVPRIAVIGNDAGPPSRDTGATGDAIPIGSGSNGTLSDAGGSGYSTPLNLIYPLMSIQERAAKDSSKVTWMLNDTDIATAQATAASADVALVFVSAWASEGYDRTDLNLTGGGDDLVQAVAAVNNNTVVVMHIPGPTVVDAWIDHPNITAVLAPLLPGEQTGPSLVSILYGDISPSGKLPFTIAKKASDYPEAITSQTEAENLAPQSDFTDGNYIDYKYFDQKNIEPRFAFGYGLGYSTFDYSNIRKNETFAFDTLAIQKTNEMFVGQKEGESLYDVLVSVDVDVKNSGSVVACEVAQLYVEFPASANQPARQLRGFDKVKQAAPGSTTTVSFPIRRKDVATWDVVQQKWVVATEPVTFHVGANSRDLPLTITHTF